MFKMWKKTFKLYSLMHKLYCIIKFIYSKEAQNPSSKVIKPSENSYEMQEALTLARKVAHAFETDQEPFFKNFYSIKNFNSFKILQYYTLIEYRKIFET